MAHYGRYPRWRPYVSVAERRRRAVREVEKLKKKGKVVRPVVIEGRTIARSFWGKAWCDNLESYSDYENRLPRGRTYVRNGSVLDLQIAPGRVSALVNGSSLYSVEVSVQPVARKLWKELAARCAAKIDSVVELLEGRLSQGVMDLLARRGSGLFPEPREISLECSCPDWAVMCKHVCAALYGIGARLDEEPELLFVLRKADHMDLVSTAGAGGALVELSEDTQAKVLDTSNLSDVFGIELDTSSVRPKGGGRSRAAKSATTRAAKNGKMAAKTNGRRNRHPKRKGRSTRATSSRAEKSRAKSVSVRSGATITAQDLIERGVPRSTFQNWVTSGTLQRTRRRGVYKATAATADLIARALGKKRRPTRKS